MRAESFGTIATNAVKDEARVMPREREHIVRQECQDASFYIVTTYKKTLSAKMPCQTQGKNCAFAVIGVTPCRKCRQSSDRRRW
jgi:hypothetical protein